MATAGTIPIVLEPEEKDANDKQDKEVRKAKLPPINKAEGTRKGIQPNKKGSTLPTNSTSSIPKGPLGATYMVGKLKANKKSPKKKKEVHHANLLEAKMMMKFTDSEGVSVIKKNLIHRFIYISKLRDDGGDRHLIGSHYEKLLKHLQNVYQSEAITGLLLIYLKHIVHVVETSSDMILKIVQDMHNTENDDHGFATKSKILIISHDIPDRLYGQWGFRMLDIQAHNLEQYESSEENVKLVGDMLSQLLKLSVYLHKQPKLNLKNALDSLYEKVPELLPQQAQMHFLLEEDDSCMVTPSEYLTMYTKPYDVVLDSELTWPLPTRLFPYH